MKPDCFLTTAALLVTLLWAPSLKSQFSPVEIQEAVDASFGPWDPGNWAHNGVYHTQLWSARSAFTLDGEDAARMMYAGPQLEFVRLRAAVTGPAKIYFSYFCGLTYARLHSAGAYVGIDSTATSLPASPYWQEGSVDVAAGAHQVSWGFDAQSVPDSGPFWSAYLDQVWTEDDPRPRVASPSFVETPKGLATTYQIVTNKPCHAYAATGLPPGMHLDVGSGLITGTPSELGSFNAMVTATNGAGSHTQSVLFRVLNPSEASAVGFDLALDGTGIQWSQRADANTEPWSGSRTGLAKDGVDAAIAPMRAAPGAGDSNWLGAEIQGPGTFSFWDRTVSFANAGREQPVEPLGFEARINRRNNFYLLPNSALGPVIGPEWNQRTVRIPNGRHFIEIAIDRGYDDGRIWRMSDALVILDQAAFTPQTENFTFLEWIQHAASYAFSNLQPEVLSEDEEGDGLGLLVEYALGGSPAYHDTVLLPTVAVIDEHLTMTVHKAPGTSGIQYTVQANKSLAGNGWTTFGTEIMEEDENLLIVRCTKTLEQEPRYMLRLRVRLDDSVGP